MRTISDAILILLIVLVVLQFVPKEPAEAPQPAIPQEPIAPSGVIAGHQNATDVYNVSYPEMENTIFDLVNEERTSRNISALKWNDDIAAVAREHSENLARDNDPLTERDLLCYMPFIHHEGYDFGLYHVNRLENRSIYYFSKSGENLFLASAWKARKTFDVEEENCPKGNLTDGSSIEQELQARLDYVKTVQRVKWLFTFATKDEIENAVVDGWMDSPGHRENILDGNYTESGIGVAQSHDFFIVTQVFIERVGCGYKDASCCNDGKELFCYEPFRCTGSVCR